MDPRTEGGDGDDRRKKKPRRDDVLRNPQNSEQQQQQRPPYRPEQQRSRGESYQRQYSSYGPPPPQGPPQGRAGYYGPAAPARAAAPPRSHHATHQRHSGRSLYWNLADRRRVEQNGLWVHTNALRVHVQQTQQKQQQPQQPVRICWHVYRLVIYPVRQVLQQSQPPQSQPSFVLEKIPLPDPLQEEESSQSIVYKTIDNTIRTPLTQQICLAWASQLMNQQNQQQQQDRQLVIVDGSETALSLQPILSADNEATRMFDIDLPLASTRDDPEEPYMAKQWFQVEVHHYHNQEPQQPHQEITHWDTALNTVLQGRLQVLEQHLTAALRWACLEARLLCFGRNPIHSYLPMPFQFDPSVLGSSRGGRRMPPPPQEPRPAVAFYATASVTQNQSLIVKANLLLNHVLPDRLQPHLTPCQFQGRIPVLNPETNTLAGVAVNLHSVISSPVTRNEILEKLKPLVLEIRYQRSLKHGAWVQTMTQQGKTKDWFEKQKWMIRKKRRFFRQDPDAMIVWDPSTYKFEWDEKSVTVSEYFKANYGITLQYPKMPLIRVGRIERLPVEVLFQGVSFAASHKDAVDAKTEDCLKFYDTFPGSKRLVHIDRVSKQVGLLDSKNDVGTIQKALARLGLGINTTQMKLKADVLQPPELLFQAGKETGIADGSWRIHNRRFLRASQFYSFAVVRSSSDIKDSELQTLFGGIQEKFQNAGVQTAFRSMTDHLTDNVVDFEAKTALPSDWDKAVQEAQEKSWHSFYRQGTGVALVRHCWGDIDKAGNNMATIKECVLVPHPHAAARDQVLAIPTNDQAKLLFSSASAEYFVQPSFYYSPGGAEVPRDRVRDIRWDHEASQLVLLPENQNVIAKALTFKRRDDATPNGVKRSLEVIFPSVNKLQISHPTVMFVLCAGILPSGHYNEIKWACEQRGMQSQVIRMDKFRAHQTSRSGAGPYLSNLTLKLNGKASNSISGATAWSIPELDSLISGMFVFGITMSFGSGVSGKMVVCGTCMLDGNAMRFGHSAMLQDKDNVVEGKLLKEMVKNLYEQWSNHSGNDNTPKRILVYRNTGNETDFKDIVHLEVNAIRSAFQEIFRSQARSASSAPPVTFVVSQNNHNLVLAPDVSHQSQRNVPGGTSLRDPDILPRTHYFEANQESNDSNGMDFFLTAHEGLKGTSKPLLYRCLVNDGDSLSNSRFDRDTLRRITYLLSFQYGTASKAVREVAVLRYGARQARRMYSVLERLVDPSFHSNLAGFTIHREPDTESGKCLYGWNKRNQGAVSGPAPQPSFDFLDAFGGRDCNGQLQLPFYSNLAM